MLIYGQLTYYRGLERLGHFRVISDLAGLNHHLAEWEADEQLRAIFKRGGVVYNNWMVQPGWVRDQANNAIVTVDKVVDHIDHICQLAGDNAHVTVGSDLDGGFGREETPRDIDTVADLQNLNGLLFKRGYGEAAILHGNWLRFLR